MEQIINQVLCACVTELKKPETDDMLKRDMIDPIVDYIGQRIWPYVVFAGCMFVTLLLTVILTSYKVSKMHTT
jgi:hypothetical protein